MALLVAVSATVSAQEFCVSRTYANGYGDGGNKLFCNGEIVMEREAKDIQEIHHYMDDKGYLKIPGDFLNRHHLYVKKNSPHAHAQRTCLVYTQERTMYLVFDLGFRYNIDCGSVNTWDLLSPTQEEILEIKQEIGVKKTFDIGILGKGLTNMAELHFMVLQK